MMAKSRKSKKRRGLRGFEPGYCFEFEGTRNWRRSSSERWPVEMCDCRKGKVVGQRRIDDAPVTVYKCSDGKYRAQTNRGAMR